MTQSEKAKFRQSAKWINYRSKRGMIDKVDAITNRKLQKGWNLHHLAGNSDIPYDYIDDDRLFVCLNKSTHEVVHTLFRYYLKDKSVLDRLAVILEKMSLYQEK